MGLTIYYSGRLRNATDLPDLIAECSDIAESLKWHHTLLPVDKDLPVKGILISPEGSEPIWLTFLDNGRLYFPGHYFNNPHPELEVIDEEENKWAFTKTQYAGMDAHVAIIKLLRYLSEKYFEEFELTDEGHFWETNDLAICQQHFDRYNSLVEIFSTAVESLEKIPGETAEGLADRIEKLLGGENFKSK